MTTWDGEAEFVSEGCHDTLRASFRQWCDASPGRVAARPAPRVTPRQVSDFDIIFGFATEGDLARQQVRSAP